MKPNNSLTTKQRKFADHYLADPKRRANRAYDVACGRGPEASANAARVGGCRMLKNPRIAAYIQKREGEVTRKLQEKYEVSEERIIRELTKVAFTNMGDVANWDADGVVVKDSSKLTPEAAAVIQEVSQTQHGIRIKLGDKRHALELLGRYKNLKLWADKKEVGLEDPLTELMAAIAKARDIAPPGVTIEKNHQALGKLPAPGSI